MDLANQMRGNPQTRFARSAILTCAEGNRPLGAGLTFNTR